MWSVTVSPHMLCALDTAEKESLNEGLTYFVHEMCFLSVNTGSSSIGVHF